MNKKLPLDNLLWLSKLLCYIFVVLTGIAIVGGQILRENSTAINSFFGIQTQKRVESDDGGSESKDYTY